MSGEPAQALVTRIDGLIGAREHPLDMPEREIIVS
jgi:hypothetical protein